jgi:2-polyprenyl-3-methyl-5-hydroxy-6-metoxy-1,4-benzoquinol methylase
MDASPSAAAAPGADKDYAYGHYDQRYYDIIRSNERRRSHRWRLRWVERCLAPKPGERIVDLGCGAGMVTRYLASRGAICHGVDLAEEAIKTARAVNAEFPSASFHVGDASHCPNLADGSFDKAISADVIEHCGPDVMRAIFAEAQRLLKPGGLYFVYTPNPLHWIERLKEWGIMTGDPTHTGLREAPVILDALRRVGFEIVEHLSPVSMLPGVNVLEKLWSLQPLGRQLAIYRIAILARKDRDEG